MRDSQAVLPRWSIIAVFCAALLAAAIVAAASDDTQAEQAPAPANEEPAAKEEPALQPVGPQPPDGKWLVAEDGRRYFVEKIRKGYEGRDYIWASEDTIRIMGGLTLDVVSEDEKTFSVKIYEVTGRPRPKPSPPPPTPEELERIALEYDPERLTPGDRLEFVSFDEGLPRKGQWRNGFDVADMNGDGHMDIVFGAPRKGLRHPHVFLGDGEGKWKPWSEALYPELPYDYGDAKAADFDGDGHIDIALAMHLTGAVVLRSDGAGRFTPWSEGIGLAARGGGRAPAFSSRAATVADWNRDGRPDLLAMGEGMGKMAKQKGGRMPPSSSGIVAFANQGDGTWQAQPVPARFFGDSIAAGDFNGDGREDVVTAANSIGARQILYLANEAGGWDPVQVEGVRPGAWVRTVAFARVDGDELDDVLVGYSNRAQDRIWRTGVDIIHGSREGSGVRRTLFSAETRAGVYGLDSGDLDGDGRLDVVALSGQGEAWIFLGGEEGAFVHEAVPELPKPVPGCAGYALRLADLDGDGRDEIVAGFAGERTGMKGITGEPGCPGEGSLRAWKARKRPNGPGDQPG